MLASVICTWVPKVVTAIAVGAAGSATPTALVVIFVGLLARLVCVNEKGPPRAPFVIFLMATVAGSGVLVNVQEMASPYSKLVML